MTYVHDGYTAGHPGRDETIRKSEEVSFGGPTCVHGSRTTFEDVRRVNREKILTHRTRTPLYKIPTTPGDVTI